MIERSAAPARTDWIDIAKGIGITLVVLGHFHPARSPGYWESARAIVYTFHMPLFFCLSGYLYVDGKYRYAQLVTNKAKRLLIPYLTIALAFLLIKLIVGRFVTLDEPVTVGTTVNVILDPIESYAPLLWFLQTLFLIFCIYPVLRRVSNDFSIIVIVILLNELIGSRYPVLGRVVANLPYFAFGVLLRGRATARGVDVGRAAPWLACAAFALGCVLQQTASRDLSRDYLEQFTLAIIGTLLVVCVSYRLAGTTGVARAWLRQLGLYSMTIYVLHPIFEGAIRIALTRISPGRELPFLGVALAAAAAGLLVPMILEARLIRRSLVARRLILGGE